MWGGSEVIIVFRDDVTIKIGGGRNRIPARYDAQGAMRDATDNRNDKPRGASGQL